MTNVELITQRERLSKNLIRPRETWTGIFHPSVESDIELKFIDARGIQCEKKLDVYLESGVRGTVQADVTDCYTLKVSRALHQF